MAQSAVTCFRGVYLYWVSLLSVLTLVLLLAGLHQSTRPEVCVRASYDLCPDLLRAEIRINKHVSRSVVMSICGDERSNACAIRRARWQRATCEVHVLLPEDPSVLRHELNHCRGWEHQGDSHEAYQRPWIPNWGLVRIRGDLN